MFNLFISALIQNRQALAPSTASKLNYLGYQNRKGEKSVHKPL